MSKRALAFLLPALLSWLVVAVEAQRPEPVPPPALLESGTGAAKVGPRLLALPFARTSVGILVGLEPLASELGASVEETAKGQGYTLVLGTESFVFGIDSAHVVSGQKLIALSQRPVLLGQTLLVPVDLFEKIFGASGFSFAWDGGRRELTVELPASGAEVELIGEVVHLQGTTTVVLRFPSGAVRYRVTETPTVLEIRLTGARFSPSSFVPRVEDPLVKGLVLQADRLRIELAPGTAHERFELAGPPFRLVFDLRPQEQVVTETTPVAPEIAPARRRGVRTIVLDPGHGGTETGALGKGGAVEKELTLLLAHEIKARLEAALPVRVLLTRSDDSLVPLRARTALANENRADLLVSIHLNSSLGASPQGAETYFLSLTASDRQAELAADMENISATAETVEDSEDLSLILWDLAQSKHLAESQRLATFIQEELNQALGLKDRGVKQAPFVVLMGATMPAVLIEFGFLSNPEEETKLGEAAYRGALADAAVRAIARFRAQVEGIESPATAPAAAAPPAAAAGPAPGEDPP